jgi:hypothetical protein
MTIGYRNGAECYSTVDEALDAHYTGSPIPVSISSNMVSSITFIKDAGAWKMNFQTNQNTYQTNVVFALPSFTPPTCTMSPTTTGSTLETGLPADFDYSILGAVFAFAVSSVVAFYVLGRGAGVVLSIFRK